MDEAEEAGGFRVVDLNYVSLYLEDLDGGVAFYGELFGPPVYEEGRLRGWRMGATWLTLFPSDAGTCAGENPRNTEYADSGGAAWAGGRVVPEVVGSGVRGLS